MDGKIDEYSTFLYKKIFLYPFLKESLKTGKKGHKLSQINIYDRLMRAFKTNTFILKGD